MRDALREALVVEGLRKVGEWTARYHFATVGWPAEPFDPFFNVNTLADLAEAERLAAIETIAHNTAQARCNRRVKGFFSAPNLATQPSEKSDDAHRPRLLQFSQLPCSLAQLIFRVLFLSLDRPHSIFRVVFLLLRHAEPPFGLQPLAFRIIHECGKSVLNFEKLSALPVSALKTGSTGGTVDLPALTFGRCEGIGRKALCYLLETAPTGSADDQNHIAPALARAIIDVVLCPLFSGTKMTFPP